MVLIVFYDGFIILLSSHSSCWLSVDDVIWSFVGPVAVVILVGLMACIHTPK